jgi:hypothetical protein
MAQMHPLIEILKKDTRLFLSTGKKKLSFQSNTGEFKLQKLVADKFVADEITTDPDYALIKLLK